MKSRKTVSELVKGTTSQFLYYRDGELWYRVCYPSEKYAAGLRNCIACGKELVSWPTWQNCDCDGKCFEFPIPVSDTGSGIFPRVIKPITLMRWIRKWHEKLKDMGIYKGE